MPWQERAVGPALSARGARLAREAWSGGSIARAPRAAAWSDGARGCHAVVFANPSGVARGTAVSASGAQARVSDTSEASNRRAHFVLGEHPCDREEVAGQHSAATHAVGLVAARRPWATITGRASRSSTTAISVTTLARIRGVTTLARIRGGTAAAAAAATASPAPERSVALRCDGTRRRGSASSSPTRGATTSSATSRVSRAATC